ncbi:MAG TPA: hypothetical protein DCK93_08765 [Blastocatellia bacterium]|jgi:hypothetical protein|nr:hypothetical protein [Blastocatellia bacterium]
MIKGQFDVRKATLAGSAGASPATGRRRAVFSWQLFVQFFSRFALIAGEGARAPSVPVSGLDHEEADDQAKQSRA